MVAVRTVGDEARDVLRDGFVGRSDEVAAFQAVLDAERSRIIWLFGPGGIGKSTLLR